MNSKDFRIGDSVYCHTDLCGFDEEGDIYKKGEYYKILDIQYRTPFSCDFSKMFFCIELEGRCNIKIVFWIVVYNRKRDIQLIKDFFYLFNDYFMSLKEHRMLKLDSLNSISL